jgi:hypothetical protein
MVGLDNKYPKQLLNNAVHKLLFSDSTVKLNKTYKSEASRFEVSVLRMTPSYTGSVSSWVTCGKKTPRSEVDFFCQVLIMYTIVVVSIYNLTVESENSNLWDVIPTVRVLYFCQSYFPRSV